MLPIVRWSGSKRYQAPTIVDNFQREINTYYEPFIGGGSVLGEYLLRLDEGNYKCNRIICSDTNEDLINIWKFIKEDFNELLNEYSKIYENFKKLNDKERKEFYNIVRSKYNELKQNKIIGKTRTIYFNWLMRTCFNGLVRYDKYGNFNTSCHFTRDGMKPENLYKIFSEWSYLLNKFNVEFLNISYNELKDIKENDLIYCDPPYANIGGMYDFGEFDNETFFNWLKELPCKYLLSYDGKSGDVNNTYNVPKELYDEHIYINSSQSGFKKLVKNNTVEVFDSLYIKERRT